LFVWLLVRFEIILPSLKSRLSIFEQSRLVALHTIASLYYTIALQLYIASDFEVRYSSYTSYFTLVASCIPGTALLLHFQTSVYKPTTQQQAQTAQQPHKSSSQTTSTLSP
jgi:hypothetical protein